MENSIMEAYNGLGYQGKEFKEFKEFHFYINEVQELARIETIPNAAQDLLTIMQEDVWKFSQIITLSNLTEQKYYIPILKYIDPNTFVEKLSLMNFDDTRNVGWSLTERYETSNINKYLLEELDWLNSVRNTLLYEADKKKGKISGYLLKLFAQHYLNEAIQKLETKNSSDIDA